MDLGGIVQVLAGLVAGAGAGFVAGGMTGYVSGFQFAQNLELLKRRVDSLWGVQNTGKGVAAREEEAAEMESLFLEVGSILKQNEGKENIDGKKIIGEIVGVATKHPKVAMKLLKKTGLKL